MMDATSTVKYRKRSLLILSAFTIVYALISLVDHYNFRTFALDLGMFNQALYAYSNGQKAYYTLDPSGVVSPFLSTHFSPITILHTPLYYLMGSYTLLVIQIASIIFGGYGIYKLSVQLTAGRHKVSLLILVQFFMTWGIFSALAFDFHNNVVGAMMLPWLTLYFVKRRAGAFVLLSALFLMTQETMALWYPFIILGLLLEFKPYWNRRSLLRVYLPLIALSIGYALLVILYIMPLLQEQTENLQLSRYAHLGDSASDIVRNIILHPIDTVKMLFTNILDDPDYDGIKTEFYFAFLLSGGFFLLLRPKLLILLIPIIAQKMLSNNYVFWGTNAQYSIECVPLLAIGTICYFTAKENRGPFIIYLSLSLTCLTTIRLLDHRISKWYLPENVRIYQLAHYEQFVDNKEVYAVLSSIPDDVPVSSSSRLAPHLARRSYLYHFPVVKNAIYIALLKTRNDHWPMEDADRYLAAIEEYKQRPDWAIVRETKDVIVFKKR